MTLKMLVNLQNEIRLLECGSWVGLKSYLIKSPVANFIRFTGVKNKNHYQLNKTLKFLRSLQTIQPLLQKFSDTLFRSSILFPNMKIEKQGLSWVIKIAIGEELHFKVMLFSHIYQLSNIL